MKRSIRFFIIASVILNIVLLGIVGGHFIHRYGHHKDREDQIVSILQNASMPEAKRNELIEQWQTVRSKDNKDRNRKAWREKTLAILTAEELDVMAYRAQLDDMLTRRSQRKQQMTDVIVDIASNLTQEERVALAEVFKERSKRWKKR